MFERKADYGRGYQMWLQAKLYMLIGFMFAILYGLIAGIGFLLGGSGTFFYILLVGAALIIILFQYLIGPKTVEWSMRVKYITEAENPRLHLMITELAQKSGLPKKPRIGISQLQIPNAFAFGRTQKDARVCVTAGILTLLNDDELKAVLGHEISHIKHHDVAVITMMSVVPMICYMIYISFFWSGMLSRGRRDNGGMMIIGLIALIVYFVSNLLVMYGSRLREYYADQGSIELGNEAHHLATALYKLVYGSARTDPQIVKRSAGMKAFFINDPSQAIQEIKELREIDLDLSGTIDHHELMALTTKKVKVGKVERILELMSSHPNMAKRISHLAKLAHQ